MKVLNLYAGIGGNRKLWGEHDITAVEINPEIANIYKDLYPGDKVIVADAHEFLATYYKNFDFIWSSPPCPTHSKLRFHHEEKIYPDMKLYQEIIFLNQWFDGNWVVENVLPYYDPLIKPQVIHRHAFWANFVIYPIKTDKMKTCKIHKERDFLQNKLGINLDKYKFKDKRLLLRNCVLPELGLHILNSSRNNKQLELNIFKEVTADERKRIAG